MRKRNISFIADKLLWFIILILPLLFAMVFTCASMNNYQLEVSASDSDTFEYVKYEFDYHTNTDYSVFITQGYTNIKDNLIVLSTSIETLDISWVIPNGVAHAYFILIADELYDSNEEYQVGSGYVLDGYAYVTLNTDFYYAIGEFGLPDNTYVSFACEYNDGFCYISKNVVIPQSDNIFKSYFSNLNYSLDNWFTFGERDIVYNAFNSIFGSQSNIMPIFVEGSFIPKYLTYMAWIYVLHLAFDFLVFIPRLAHKWMGGVYKDEDS